jgi:hypothetical protein
MRPRLRRHHRIEAVYRSCHSRAASGSEAVVANHSETLYSIITETTGVDTSDPALFPKEDGSTTRVRNFNDLWVVRLPISGRGRLIRHYVFDLTLRHRID